MQTFQADLAIVGAGGAGLRAAIAAAQANPNAKIALISKVYPMRSHTVAAEGGSAAVAQDHDSFEYHFHDTVAGGDWLCEQDVVENLRRATANKIRLEHWGCPWSEARMARPTSAVSAGSISRAPGSPQINPVSTLFCAPCCPDLHQVSDHQALR
ncbi:FAD-binding protein [Escherichia coli]